MPIELRPLTVDDAPALQAAYLRNREHLQPWEPVRPDSFWTLAGQRDRLAVMEKQRADGSSLPCGVFDQDRVVGTITLQTIVRGPFCSASLGYWIDGAETGRGLATTAVARMLEIADQDLLLHRLDASTMVANLASQRVLQKCGFVKYGTATTYLHINGQWSDSHLWQRILNDRPPGSAVRPDRF